MISTSYFDRKNSVLWGQKKPFLRYFETLHGHLPYYSPLIAHIKCTHAPVQPGYEKFVNDDNALMGEGVFIEQKSGSHYPLSKNVLKNHQGSRNIDHVQLLDIFPHLFIKCYIFCGFEGHTEVLISIKSIVLYLLTTFQTDLTYFLPFYTGTDRLRL